MNCFEKIPMFAEIEKSIDVISPDNTEVIKNQINDIILKTTPEIIKEYYSLTCPSDSKKSLIVNASDCYTIMPQMYVRLNRSTVVQILKYTADILDDNIISYYGIILCRKISESDVPDPTPFVIWNYTIKADTGLECFYGSYYENIETAVADYNK